MGLGDRSTGMKTRPYAAEWWMASLEFNVAALVGRPFLAASQPSGWLDPLESGSAG